MLTQRIQWKPSGSPNVFSYEIEYSDTDLLGPYSVLGVVYHQIPGPDYIDSTGVFFKDDAEVPYRYYRMYVLDQFGNRTPPTPPFKADGPVLNLPPLNILPLDENTGGVDRLRYITDGGNPVGGATIRVYKKQDYDAKQYSLVQGITKTNAFGRWEQPIFVEYGLTYTIVYQKPNEFGPDKVEITV